MKLIDPNTEVINYRDRHEYDASQLIYIGRGSIWGNPYRIGQDGTREEVIEKYRDHLASQIREGKITGEDILSLQGKKLVCFCKPEPCHGDVLVKAIEYMLILDHALNRNPRRQSE